MVLTGYLGRGELGLLPILPMLILMAAKGPLLLRDWNTQILIVMIDHISLQQGGSYGIRTGENLGMVQGLTLQ